MRLLCACNCFMLLPAVSHPDYKSGSDLLSIVMQPSLLFPRHSLGAISSIFFTSSVHSQILTLVRRPEVGTVLSPGSVLAQNCESKNKRDLGRAKC